MRPEELDKLFKERLGNSSPTPPSDLWARLQDRMEAEKPLQIQPKEEKKNFMWIYSSVAASVSLVLAVGMVFYNIKTSPEVSEALVKQDQPVLEETPYFKEQPAEETIAQVEIKNPEKISEPQATTDATPASNIAETVDKTAYQTKATKTKVANAKAVNQPKADVQQAIAVNTPTVEKPVERASTVPVTTAPSMAVTTTASNAEMNARPVEITIKRSVAAAEATPVVDDNQPNGIGKKAKLAKNIFKQMRNLANGEQVELAELGIKADRLALETQIGKQKISKVINL